MFVSSVGCLIPTCSLHFIHADTLRHHFNTHSFQHALQLTCTFPRIPHTRRWLIIVHIYIIFTYLLTLLITTRTVLWRLCTCLTYLADRHCRYIRTELSLMLLHCYWLIVVIFNVASAWHTPEWSGVCVCACMWLSKCACVW